MKQNLEDLLQAYVNDNDSNQSRYERLRNAQIIRETNSHAQTSALIAVFAAATGAFCYKKPLACGIAFAIAAVAGWWSHFSGNAFKEMYKYIKEYEIQDKDKPSP